MRRSAVASSFLTLGLGFGLGLGLLTGCPDRSIDTVNPLQGRVEAKDIPVNVNRDLDLLFLIDDSPSMADKQSNLAKNFPRFIEVLSSIPGGLPNIHIGVATSDMGTQGEDKQPPGLAIGSPGQGGCSGFGKDGVLQVFGAAGMIANNATYISDLADATAPGGRQRNYTGDLNVVFGEMANAGAGGCAFEQHLAGVKRALSNPANAGFVRPDAYLGIIIIADEDDCSLQHSALLGSNDAVLGALESFRCTRFGVICDDGGATPDTMNQVGPKNKCHPNDTSAYLSTVTDYVKFVKSLKTDPNKIIVAGIEGTIDPFLTELRAPRTGATPIPALAHSCTYVDVRQMTEVADPPIRTKFFLDQFPNRNTFSTICQQDLSGGLQQIGDLLKTALGNPCIDGKLADVDPVTPGPQYDCSVSVVTNQGAANQTEKILPLCTPQDMTASNAPCWHLKVDATGCPQLDLPVALRDHLSLVIEGEATLPKDAHIVANCVTEVTNGTNP